MCAAEGAKFGVRLRDLRRNPGTLGVIDTDGNFVENVPVPRGWDWWGLTAAGIVFCDGDERGRLRAFRGSTTPLSSCPLTVGPSGLLFASADRREIVDGDGRRVVSLRRRLPSFAHVETFGDGLIAVDADLYRAGRLVVSLDLTDGIVLGASRSGDVTLVSDAARAHLAVMLRDGTRRAIDPTVASRGGALVARRPPPVPAARRPAAPRPRRRDPASGRPCRSRPPRAAARLAPRGPLVTRRAEPLRRAIRYGILAPMSPHPEPA